MTSAKRRKARPAIKPIKTNVAGWEGPLRRVLTPSRCTRCSASPMSPRARAGMASPAGRAELRRPGAAGRITPLAVEPAEIGLSPAESDKPSVRKGGPGDPASATDGGGPSVEAGLTPTEWKLVHFQRFRAGLWQRGFKDFGDVGQEAVFVMPEALRRPSVAAGQSSGDGGQEDKPPLLEEGRLSVRAVIHSKDRKPIGLKREFDLRELRATIPDPLPSPRSPNFDRTSLLAAVSMEGEMLSPTWAAYPCTPRAGGSSSSSSTRSGPPETPLSTPPPLEKLGTELRPVPIHLPYARAHLPVLAAIMLSTQVHGGDRIDLPMPQPKAWTETAAFVYTGEEELLTDEVKQNIVYLGGKV